MNKFVTATLCFAIFFLNTGCEKTGAKTQPDSSKPAAETAKEHTDVRTDVASHLQQALDKIYSNNPNSIGILVHVEAQNQATSWSGAAGYSNNEKTTKLEAGQPAILASNTKTYVAAAILKLVEGEKLKLESPIENHLAR